MELRGPLHLTTGPGLACSCIRRLGVQGRGPVDGATMLVRPNGRLLLDSGWLEIYQDPLFAWGLRICGLKCFIKVIVQ